MNVEKNKERVKPSRAGVLGGRRVKALERLRQRGSG